jgi:hypothetical protein
LVNCVTGVLVRVRIEAFSVFGLGQLILKLQIRGDFLLTLYLPFIHLCTDLSPP